MGCESPSVLSSFISRDEAAIRAAHTGLFCRHCSRTESLRFLELIFARQAAAAAAADLNDEGWVGEWVDDGWWWW